MTAHTTPGPWTCERVPTSIGHVWKIQPVGACVYVDNGGRVTRTDAEGAAADARLIAAAPELRDALREIRDRRYTLDADMRDAMKLVQCIAADVLARLDGDA